MTSTLEDLYDPEKVQIKVWTNTVRNLQRAEKAAQYFLTETDPVYRRQIARLMILEDDKAVDVVELLAYRADVDLFTISYLQNQSEVCDSRHKKPSDHRLEKPTKRAEPC